MEEIRLENWYLDHDQIVGDIYGSVEFEDGATIRTPRIACWDLKMEYAYTVKATIS